MIKIHLLVCLGISFLFLSCEYNAYPTQNTEQNWRLTKIPTPSHDNNIKLYFQNEPVKDTNYVKIGILEAVSRNGGDDNELLKILMELGQENGVDGIIVLGFSNDNYSLNSGVSRVYSVGSVGFISNNSVNVDERRVKGLGIKFLKNINYAHDFVKYKECFAYDSLSNDYKRIGQIKYDFEQKKLDFDGDKSLYNYYMQYSSDYILIEEKNWRFLFNNDEKTVFTRKHFIDFDYNIWDIKCKIETEKADCDCFSKIEVTRKIGKKTVKQSLSRKEDKNKYVDEWTFSEGKIPVWRHSTLTDTNYIPIKEEIYDLKYSKDKPVYKEIYVRYTNEDFYKILRDEGFIK